MNVKYRTTSLNSVHLSFMLVCNSKLISAANSILCAIIFKNGSAVLINYISSRLTLIQEFYSNQFK